MVQRGEKNKGNDNSNLRKLSQHHHSWYEGLGWLISCAHLTGLRVAQAAGKTLFLGESVRVLLEEFHIGIGSLSKEVACGIIQCPGRE